MKSRISVIIVMLLIGAMMASCAPAPTPAPATAAPTLPPATAAPATEAPTATTAYPPAPEFIELGASIPLTGKFGSLGTQVKVGYDYAIADINAAGGVM